MKTKSDPNFQLYVVTGVIIVLLIILKAAIGTSKPQSLHCGGEVKMSCPHSLLSPYKGHGWLCTTTDQEYVQALGESCQPISNK